MSGAGSAVGAAVLVAAVASVPKASLADEGGVSFWLTGQFGSLAAVPQQPGWSIASTFYYTSLSGGGEVAAAREVEIDKFKRTLNVNLNLNLKARADLVFLSPTYVFASPVTSLLFVIRCPGPRERAAGPPSPRRKCAPPQRPTSAAGRRSRRRTWSGSRPRRRPARRPRARS